jgi:hypothetical protein
MATDALNYTAQWSGEQYGQDTVAGCARETVQGTHGTCVNWLK